MNPVEIELNGQKFVSEYTVDDGVITVYGDSDSEFTTLGGSDELPMAKILLRRLAERGKIDPEIYAY